MLWGLLGLQEKPYLFTCLGERATLGRSLGWHSQLPFFCETLPRALGSLCPAFCPVDSGSMAPNQPDPSPLPGPQETHRLYRLKLEELTKLQNNCTSSITRQKKQLQEMALVLKKLGPPLKPSPTPLSLSLGVDV